MIEIAFNHPELPLWYGASQIFPSADAAKQAFHRINEHSPEGQLDVGVYRHMRVGLDTEAVVVSVVGVRKEGVEIAESLMDGKDLPLHPATWVQMISRRAEMVLALAPKGVGSYRIPHSPEGDVIA